MFFSTTLQLYSTDCKTIIFWLKNSLAIAISRSFPLHILHLVSYQISDVGIWIFRVRVPVFDLDLEP